MSQFLCVKSNFVLILDPTTNCDSVTWMYAFTICVIWCTRK